MGLMKKTNLLILFLVLIVILTGCNIMSTKERKFDDAKEIATKEFNLSEVYSVSAGTLNSILVRDNVKKGFMYVFGRSNKDYKLVIVPLREKDIPYEANWPFNFSFTNSVDIINSTDLGTLVSETDFKTIEFFDDLNNLKGVFNNDKLDELEFDFQFFYLFNEKYLVSQINNKCVIIGEGFN